MMGFAMAFTLTILHVTSLQGSDIGPTNTACCCFTLFRALQRIVNIVKDIIIGSNIFVIYIDPSSTIPDTKMNNIAFVNVLVSPQKSHATDKSFIVEPLQMHGTLLILELAVGPGLVCDVGEGDTPRSLGTISIAAINIGDTGHLQVGILAEVLPSTLLHPCRPRE